MTPDQQESAMLVEVDRFWSEYGEDVRNLAAELENIPKTYPGEQAVKDLLLPRLREQQSIVSVVYARLANIVHTLVYLSEAKVGADLAGDNFFSDSDNQLILLKALGLYIEKVFKQPFDETEKPNYYGYRPIFEGFLKELRILEMRIKEQQEPLPNIVGSLIMVFGHALEASKVEVDGNLTFDYIKRKLNLEQDDKAKENFKAVFSSFQSKVASWSVRKT